MTPQEHNDLLDEVIEQLEAAREGEYSRDILDGYWNKGMDRAIEVIKKWKTTLEPDTSTTLDTSLEARLRYAEADVIRLHRENCDLRAKYEWINDPEPEKVDAWAIMLMSAAAKSGDPRVIKLAAQLANVQPCEKCGYIHYHCQCEIPNA